MNNAASTPAILARDLRKSFGKKVVLYGVDLTVAEGSVFALLVPNGAGKTTAINIFSTLMPPDAGQVRLESSYGALEVGIRQGTAAWVDVATQHSSVINSLGAHEGPGASDETADVRARSSWGDIVIRRSNEQNTKNRSNS